MSSYTSPDRPGDPPIPDYRWVPGTPDPKYGSSNGCTGCAFRKQLAIRCSRIPCQRYPGLVAELIPVCGLTTPTNTGTATCKMTGNYGKPPFPSAQREVLERVGNFEFTEVKS